MLTWVFLYNSIKSYPIIEGDELMNFSEQLLRDYVDRTLANLRFIEKMVHDNPEAEVYETTQLINSLLGLLIFPYQHMNKEIPNKSIQEMLDDGWIVPKVVGDFPQVKNLRQLIRYLRNSIAHFHIEFLSDKGNQINRLRVWNVKEIRKGDVKIEKTTWKAEMTLSGLRDNVFRFIDIVLSPANSKTIDSQDVDEEEL